VFYKKHPGILQGPEGLFAYDLNNGKPLGKKSAVPFTSDPESGLLFAFFPFDIKGIKADINIADNKILEIKGSLKTSDPVKEEKLVVLVRVLKPDGTEQTVYKRSVDCTGNAFAYKVPLGLNEKGKYKVILREPCSGKTFSQEVNIK
jgi:hypothetical protein